ncbi:hypothetical protein [Seonamhaeicola sp.]|uniref:hypothetical protein n=1 Tax=Seonamhaeicola sp. TaxID=1912245 RepID=UPI0035633E40
MASSYRQDLKNGRMQEWEKPLREAIQKIEFVIEEIYNCDSGQTDNAKDEGALSEKLYLAKRFIEEELPNYN